MSPHVKCIVCERTGNLAAALRWHSADHPLPLAETRSLMAARAVLLESPASVFVLETTTANAEGVLRLLLEAANTCPAARGGVLLTAGCRSLAPLFWEIGALFVARSPRRIDRVVRLIQRQLSRQESPELSVRDKVWANLPW
jgi:hypothetical protein